MQGKKAPLGAATADLLLQSAQADQKPEQRTLVTGAIHWGVSQFGVGESNTRNNIEDFVGNVATAVPLFMSGGRGLALSGVMFGLNQAKWGDTTTHQLEDASLGVIKGLGTKAVFDHFGARKDMNFAAKGVTMGALSRGLGVGLTRETWFDQAGNFQPLAGAENTTLSMFHPVALATDIATFGAAHFGIKGANWLTNGLVEKSPLVQTALTGTTFGFTSGALGEVHRQFTDPKAHFDPLAILGKGGLSAAEMTIAGGLGHKFSDPTAPNLFQPKTERFTGFDWFTGALGRAKEKVSQSAALARGQDLGMVLASGDVKGPDGEVHRSVGPEANPPDTSGEHTTAGGGDAIPAAPDQFRPNQEGVWKNADHDQPVIVRQYLGEHDGRHYVQVDRVMPDGSIEAGSSGIPLDEIAYKDGKTTDQTRVAETAAVRPEVKTETGAADWVGTKYDEQQDSHWVSPDGKVALVADGIGGNSAGEVASQIAADVFSRRYADYPQNGGLAEQQGWLSESVRAADKAVVDAQKSGTYVTVDGRTLTASADMGSTIVASAQAGDKLLISYAGDSRAYRLRNGVLEQLTEDHQTADTGAITRWLGGGLSQTEAFNATRDAQGRLIQGNDSHGRVRTYSYEGDTTNINRIGLQQSSWTKEADGSWTWRSGPDIAGSVSRDGSNNLSRISVGSQEVYRASDNKYYSRRGATTEVPVTLNAAGLPESVVLDNVTWRSVDGGKTWNGTSHSSEPMSLDQRTGALTVGTGDTAHQFAAVSAIRLGETRFATEDGGKTWTSPDGKSGQIQRNPINGDLTIVDATGQTIGSGPFKGIFHGDGSMESADGNSWDTPNGRRFGRMFFDPATNEIGFVRNLEPQDILAGDRYLLATDGLEKFGAKRTQDILNQPSSAPEAARNLIDGVEKWNDDDFGQDNVTAVVIDGPRAERARPAANPADVAGYVEADLKAPAGFTSDMVQEGIDILAAAATAKPGSEAETAFYEYARSRTGSQLQDVLQQVAREMDTDRARQLVESAFTPDTTLSIPAGREQSAQAGIDLIKKMTDDPSAENVRAFRQFVLGEGKDLGEVMVQAAQAMAKASNNSEVLALVEGAYKPATEFKYDGPPELGRSYLQGYDLYKATQSEAHTADDVQRLVDFARSPEGQRLEFQMLDLAGRMEGQDGYNFMRDYVYHGSDARISVGDTGERIYIAPEKEDAARKLIGLCEGASEPGQPTWYYDYLSKAARDADPDVRNAMLEYAEKSGNEAMLITARDALVSKANVEINMTAEQAARFGDFQTVVSNRPQMTPEGIEAYKTWINQFLDANTDLQTYVKQMAPYIESSAAVDAIDQYFKTNNLDTFPVSRLRAAEIDSANRTSDNPAPTTPASERTADAAPRVSARDRVMNMPMDDLLNQLHTSPDRLTQEQAAVGAQLRLPEMTDEQFASYLQWLYAPGPDGRYNMNSIQFPNRSVLERPDVIASLTGDTVTTTDAATNAPVEHNPQFSIEALHQFLTIPLEGVPPFPAWLDAVVQRQAITGETLPNWLINDIKSRWIITNNPRLSPENPASVSVPQAVREQINADDANQKAQQAQPGANNKKQRAPQAATAESMGNRLATLATLLDAKTPDAVERLMQLGSQDARVLNDVVTRLQRFGQVPELRELIRLTLPQADNIYTLNIMLRSMEDASSMARKDAGRAQTAAQLAQAAADQMLPADPADQGKVSRIIDKMAGGKYDVPRPPRKPFPGQEQKPARPERPQPPQVPFFSNDAQPIDIAAVQASPAQPARKGGPDQLARSANDAAGDPAGTTEAADFTEPPVLSSEHELDVDDRNGGAPRAPRVPDVVNPTAPDPSAKPKTPAHEFNETIPSYEPVLDNAYNNEEGAIGYSAYVSKYFKSVLTRNMPQDNLTIVVPEGYDSTPALKFIMRSGIDGQPAVVYQGRIVLETQAQAEAHTAQGKPILERPLGILVSDGNGGSRLVTANELATVATQISKGTFDYNRDATQPPVVQKPTPQPPVKATYEQLNADEQTVLGVMRAAKNAIVRNSDGSTSGGTDKMYTMFEISRDSGVPEGARLKAIVADLVQKGVVETDGRGLYKQTAEIQTELRDRMRQAMSGLAAKFNQGQPPVQPDPVVEGASGNNGAVDNNVVVDNNTVPVETQTIAPAEAPVRSMQERQQDAIFDAIRDVSRQKGKGQYADVRIEDLRKVPKVDGQYVSDQIIKHWLKQWVREGLLQMKGSGYVPTTDFDAMVKQQAEAARAARQAQQNGGDGSGTTN
jgi:serine/threonine protein phosphatase PrpC